MKNLICLLLFIFSSFNANAKLEDYFKKAHGKTNCSSMRNLDFIYLINLDQRPEKLEQCLSQLEPYDIVPYRFSAVNGWELSIEDINNVGLKYRQGMMGGFMATSYHPNGNFEPSHEIIRQYGQTYFVHCMARGTIGIVLSHLSILQDAYDSGYQTIWVMEDDIEVIRDPSIIPDLIDELDNQVGKHNWDLLFTDRDIRDCNGNYVPCHGAAKRPNFNPLKQNRYSKRTIKDNFIKTGARFGATSIIYRRSGMEKILNFIKSHSIFLPYDMDFYLPPGIKLYTVKEDIVTNLTKALSDNGGANYLNKKAEIQFPRLSNKKTMGIRCQE